MWIAGLVGLVLAAVFGYLASRARSRLRAMAGAETLTARELTALQEAAATAAGAGFFQHECEVVGVAEPGSNGVLRSELSDTECVWHRHIVTRKYWTTERRRNSNGDYRSHRVERQERVADAESSQPFSVRDQTGTVVVHPAGALDDMEQVVDRFEPEDEADRRTEISLGKFHLSLPSGAREGTIGYSYEEWVLRAGQRLYVLGEASDAGGELAFVKPSLVSTKNEAELTGDFERKQKIFTAVAGVAAVVGIVLVVIGVGS